MTFTPSNNPPSVWVLADDRAGNRSQCFGVADALGFDYQVKNPAYGPLASLPNFLLGASFAGVNTDSRSQLSPPWPDLVIAAGRRTAPVARKIKRLAGQKCFLAQIMHPGTMAGAGVGDFGLIAVPNHDGIVTGPNIISFTGAPHGLTVKRLTDEAKHWHGRFDDLASPRIALIVGGTTRRRAFTSNMAAGLGRMASEMATRAGGALLVTTSRRTGEAEAALLDAISAPKRVYRWGEDGENPYLGYLACADAIIVTGDSVSMCSEACAGTGPVYIYAPTALITPKHARLHAELYKKGYARPLNSALETWNHAPLNPAGDIAAAIRERLGR